MSNKLSVEIVARDFNRMLEELAAIDPKIEFRDVVLGAAERVINGALRNTKDAKAAKIRATFGEKTFTTFNGKRYKLSHHYPDALWRQIDAQRKARLSVKLAARGLAKQSWRHVGASFGANATSPAYVSAANYKGRQYSANGQSSETAGGPDYALTIINSSPIVQAAGGEFALLRAMRGEARYFEMNMAKRAFRTFESRVKKYPQIFAREGV